MRSVTSNRPLRELVAEAKAEVMEEIEDNREEGEEDDAMELAGVTKPGSFLFKCPCYSVRIVHKKKGKKRARRIIGFTHQCLLTAESQDRNNYLSL